jgi:hypothetical protein
MERHAPLAVPLAARHLGPSEAATDLHADPLRAAAHRRLHAAAHRPAERDAAGQLLGDPLSDERCLELRLLELDHIQLHVVLAGHLSEVVSDPVDLDPAPADDDARPRRVDVDLEPVTFAFDVDARDARMRQAVVQVLPDLQVFLQPREVRLVGVPARAPLVVRVRAQPEPVRVNLLAHAFPPSVPRRS